MDSHVTDPQALLERIRAAGTQFQSERVGKAYAIAESLYQGEMHWSGVPFLTHVLEVLETLLPFEPDEDAVIATLLHHVLSLKGMTFGEIEDRFGTRVRALVGGVHLLAHVTVHDRRHSIDDLRLILLTVSDDVRTVLIALCDRCTLLRRAAELPRPVAKKLSQDALQLFAPVASRLGIYTLKRELEERAFPVMYPGEAERIQEQLARLIAEKGKFLEQAAVFVSGYLAEQNIDATVDARQKQSYSVFSKMRSKSISHVSDVYDLFALRVIVPSEAECYQALGLLHRLGRPIANRFKDYIAFPKPNGYQSLHTTLAQLPHVPEGVFVEIQIRTVTMHREAQFGVAAHWSYKEKGSRTAHALAQAQLQRLLSTQQSIEQGTGKDALVDHIFVLTPRGDIIELPEGATPLDFAFQVHTDLGLAFRAARVNGVIVPLNYALKNGDVVEIMKRKIPEPSSQWLQLLKTASSKSKLKRYLYAQQRPELIGRGRELLNAELLRVHLPVLDTDLTVLKSYDGEKLTKERREDILMKIGQEAEKAATALTHFDALKGKLIHDLPSRIVRNSRKETVVGIEGNVPMPVRYAKCCEPQEWPRGDIAGVINRSGAVMVHRDECKMFKNASKGRRVRIWWK
ncbi:MAG: GTP pyrophosphokinase [Candidatus Peregrinibacteria bacterium Greene0416_62]|nr:MAG: GTP pyrophosphokinase [Candidatus Peregrinibacteria bacterium Greene0416_62]